MTEENKEKIRLIVARPTIKSKFQTIGGLAGGVTGALAGAALGKRNRATGAVIGGAAGIAAGRLAGIPFDVKKGLKDQSSLKKKLNEWKNKQDKTASQSLSDKEKNKDKYVAAIDPRLSNKSDITGQVIGSLAGAGLGAYAGKKIFGGKQGAMFGGTAGAIIGNRYGGGVGSIHDAISHHKFNRKAYSGFKDIYGTEKKASLAKIFLEKISSDNNYIDIFERDLNKRKKGMVNHDKYMGASLGLVTGLSSGVLLQNFTRAGIGKALAVAAPTVAGTLIGGYLGREAGEGEVKKRDKLIKKLRNMTPEKQQYFMSKMLREKLDSDVDRERNDPLYY